jgi:5'-nucleotidase/UDP-sugar diphosphatase
MIMFRALANLLVLGASSVVSQSPSTVTFLHMNDHHSHVEELSFDIKDSLLIPADLSVESEAVRMFYGGFPRAVALMKQMEEAALTAGNDVLKVHGGDALSGTVFYSFFGPAMDAAVMNVAGFDAFVIGNHEFDDGDANLAEFLEMIEFPALSYNSKYFVVQ